MAGAAFVGRQDMRKRFTLGDLPVVAGHANSQYLFVVDLDHRHPQTRRVTGRTITRRGDMRRALSFDRTIVVARHAGAFDLRMVDT